MVLLPILSGMPKGKMHFPLLNHLHMLDRIQERPKSKHCAQIYHKLLQKCFSKKWKDTYDSKSRFAA